MLDVHPQKPLNVAWFRPGFQRLVKQGRILAGLLACECHLTPPVFMISGCLQDFLQETSLPFISKWMTNLALKKSRRHGILNAAENCAFGSKCEA